MVIETDKILAGALIFAIIFAFGMVGGIVYEQSVGSNRHNGNNQFQSGYSEGYSVGFKEGLIFEQQDQIKMMAEFNMLGNVTELWDNMDERDSYPEVVERYPYLNTSCYVKGWYDGYARGNA